LIAHGRDLASSTVFEGYSSNQMRDRWRQTGSRAGVGVRRSASVIVLSSRSTWARSRPGGVTGSGKGAGGRGAAILTPPWVPFGCLKLAGHLDRRLRGDLCPFAPAIGDVGSEPVIPFSGLWSCRSGSLPAPFEEVQEKEENVERIEEDRDRHQGSGIHVAHPTEALEVDEHKGGEDEQPDDRLSEGGSGDLDEDRHNPKMMSPTKAQRANRYRPLKSRRVA
jgi:hypothetical protein